MLTIQHRVNSKAQLMTVPIHRGVEVDVRSNGGELELSHDPFVEGEVLEGFLQHFRHELIIFNVKCDGLESKIIDLARKFGIEKYFFLDAAIPTIVKRTDLGQRNFAVRFSEYEPLDYALRFAGKVDWVWVDCFTQFPLSMDIYEQLKAQFKICLVSPELLGRPWQIARYIEDIKDMDIDAVCTDSCERWEQSRLSHTQVS